MNFIVVDTHGIRITYNLVLSKYLSQYLCIYYYSFIDDSYNNILSIVSSKITKTINTLYISQHAFFET